MAKIITSEYITQKELQLYYIEGGYAKKLPIGWKEYKDSMYAKYAEMMRELGYEHDYSGRL